MVQNAVCLIVISISVPRCSVVSEALWLYLCKPMQEKIKNTTVYSGCNHLCFDLLDPKWDVLEVS